MRPDVADAGTSAQDRDPFKDPAHLVTRRSTLITLSARGKDFTAHSVLNLSLLFVCLFVLRIILGSVLNAGAVSLNKAALEKR